MSGNLQRAPLTGLSKDGDSFLKLSVNQDQLCSSSFIFSMGFSPILPVRLWFWGGADLCTASASRNSCSSLLVHMEKMFICVWSHWACSAGQGLTAYILSTPFKQGVSTAASRQARQALEGFGNHWRQSNDRKMTASEHLYLHTVGHLLHKRLALFWHIWKLR